MWYRIENLKEVTNSYQNFPLTWEIMNYENLSIFNTIDVAALQIPDDATKITRNVLDNIKGDYIFFNSIDDETILYVESLYGETK